MNEQYEEVKPAELNPGDVVHVSFKSEYIRSLFLNKKVNEVTGTHVSTEGGYYFYKEYSRFYLVEKAKKSLPTAIGSAVKHPDGWQFIRIGYNLWKAIEANGRITSIGWSDEEVAIVEDWKEL